MEEAEEKKEAVQNEGLKKHLCYHKNGAVYAAGQTMEEQLLKGICDPLGTVWSCLYLESLQPFCISINMLVSLNLAKIAIKLCWAIMYFLRFMYFFLSLCIYLTINHFFSCGAISISKNKGQHVLETNKYSNYMQI